MSLSRGTPGNAMQRTVHMIDGDLIWGCSSSSLDFYTLGVLGNPLPNLPHKSLWATCGNAVFGLLFPVVGFLHPRSTGQSFPKFSDSNVYIISFCVVGFSNPRDTGPSHFAHTPDYTHWGVITGHGKKPCDSFVKKKSTEFHMSACSILDRSIGFVLVFIT